MGVVSILTHSFTDGYNREFARVFGGGLERYILDLCSVIHEMGHIPEVHQLSYFEAFQTRTGQIDVFGYPYDMNDVPEAFTRMAEAARGPIIYASCIWQPIAYKPGSLGICHGINWDRPALPLETKQQVAEHIQQAVDGLLNIVSVDSHFQTYCRASCTFSDPAQLILIPNAVDTAYFTPAPPRRQMQHEQEAQWLSQWKEDLEHHEDRLHQIVISSTSDATSPDLDRDHNTDEDVSENKLKQKHQVQNKENEESEEQPEGLAVANKLNEQDASSRPVRILYPRRVSLERGIIPMMLAADQLLGAFPDLEIEFAGELVEGSTVGRSFRYWHRTHPHADRIFHHTYDFRDIREAYHHADIAVIPTIFSEGTSYACLEAMSCGLPVVASNVGGLNDLIQDGFNGLLVPPNQEALTAALVRLVQDRAERERLGIYARETALAYDLSRWKHKWSEVLRTFLANVDMKEGVR
ncbi:glycosyltransferase family 4 protein [Paenibacillus sp. MER 99-2]|uniref:glycosyltransferase family 4 protein n=1 Tax=Paenibacillus sp. MER 99-2 TaxID=2939572 RepID=UPI00203E3FBD|nr:glycosyltransferase family 4 protein [Paenibacillus sp. MER 99-2]MCM3173890.1 glycosyltransferase family 4 protein [Paenibacillus sp. MER 99-2]